MMYAQLIAYNADESAVLRLVLQRAGFAAKVFTDPKQAIQEWDAQPLDLILLSCQNDPPTEIIGEFRSKTEVPMIIISQPLKEDFHIDLLDLGVDLIVFRPYSSRLLIAQIRGLLRRATGVTVFNLPNFSVNDLTLDPSVRTIQIKDNPPKHLTRLEFRLLYTLMVHSGQVLSTESLVEQVWGYSGRGDRDLVRGLVKRLRAKVEPDPHAPQYILTIPGVGYRLVQS